MDHAAATPLDPLVKEAMEPYWTDVSANPHAVHTEGRHAREAVEEARTVIANALGAQHNELVFTSGGTESNMLALLGVLHAHSKSGRKPENTHLITSVIEHPSVRDCFRELERKGYAIDSVPVTGEGVITPDSVASVLRPETVFVSLMFANNEIGTIEPIAEIGTMLKKHTKETGAPLAFHTDASQAPLFTQMDVVELGVDLLTVDAQKMYGPKGVGGLYVREGTLIESVCKGGNQEYGLRAGTINTPGVVGFARAWKLAEERRTKDTAHLKELQTYFFTRIKEAIPEAMINGSTEHRLPNNVNISLPGVSGEFAVLLLDEHGIAASTRSACLAGGKEGSYVVDALGVGGADRALRFSMGREVTKENIDRVVSALMEIIKKSA